MRRFLNNAQAAIAAGALSLTLVYSIAAAAQQAKPGRVLTLEDMFALEEIGRYFGGPYSISPDGASIAFVRLRSQQKMKDFSKQYLWGGESADVWLQRGPKEAPIRLTQGEEDGTGWWAPQWSPDGRYLTMLSTRGGNVCLWVDEVAVGQLKQLSTRGIDLANISKAPAVWTDATHVVIPLLPAGKQPLSMTVDTETPDIATDGWKKQREGAVATASVLESGLPVNLAERQQSELDQISVADGSKTVVAAENTTSVTLAPNGKFVAYARQVGVYAPKADELLPFGTENGKSYSVVVRDTAGKQIADSVKQSRDVLIESFRWSPDGSQLAFLGYGDSRLKPAHLFLIDTGTGGFRDIDLGSLEAAPIVRLAPQLEWVDGDSLLVLAATRTGSKLTGVEDRRDWWLIRRDGTQRCVTDKLTKVPDQLWPMPDRKAFVGLADGQLWKVSTKPAAPLPLAGSFSQKITAIAWPVSDDPYGSSDLAPDGGTYSELIVNTGEGDAILMHRVNLDSGAIQPVDKPSPKAILGAYDQPHGTYIFSASDRTGSFVWRASNRASERDTLVSTNLFLNDIADGKYRQIEYTSLEGEKLKAWIMLPFGYEKGKKYPMLTWVYAGSVARDKPSALGDISFYSPLNLQLAAAHGYAVLMPSMPLKPEGEVDDPMLRLMNGVMPAVDKAVDTGIADAAHLYLMGQSFGGFSTYGLVTQTNRFKAAVSLAGLSDLISLYGQFDARMRYGSYPHEDLFTEALMEGAQVHMGTAPWKDLGRYIRNSPIFFVDRVQTPVLIIQGDLDYVAMQQGEEFFRALYRQGKRARFVRYWGEDHVLASPANIRDMWKEIFDWCDNSDHGAVALVNPTP